MHCLNIGEWPIVTHTHTHTQNNRKNYSFVHLIYIFNKIYIWNANLLQNSLFGRLSSWLPQRKHFCADEILTKFSQFTEQAFITVDRHWQHATYLSRLVAVFSTAAVCQRTAPEQNTCTSLCNFRKNVTANRQPLGKTHQQNHFISSLFGCGVLIGCGRSEDQTVTWCHRHCPYLRHPVGVNYTVHIFAPVTAFSLPVQNLTSSRRFECSISGNIACRLFRRTV